MKVNVAPVIIGIDGAGKSLLCELVGDIYGDKIGYRQIDNNDLHSDFNDWLEAKRLICADEIVSSKRRGEADFIKNLITRPQNPINLKYGAKFVERNCATYYLTSNHPDALTISDTDRRFMIFESRAPKLLGPFIDRMRKWWAADGAAHLRYFLEHYQITKFNPDVALATADKIEMAHSSLDDLDLSVRRLADEPYRVLSPFDVQKASREGKLFIDGPPPLEPWQKMDFWTIKQILEAYDFDRRLLVTGQAMGAALRKLRPRRFWHAPKTRTCEGVIDLWCVNNIEQWERASPTERAYEFNRHYDASKPKRYPVAEKITDINRERTRRGMQAGVGSNGIAPSEGSKLVAPQRPSKPSRKGND